MKGKRILITGGAGSIGQEIVRQLVPKNKIFILDINETGTFDLREELKQKGYWVHSRTGDIRNTNTLFDVFSDFKPQIVIHAAALKHVTPNEEYPEEAIQTNIVGTMNVMQEASRHKEFEKFVFISTDKVVNASCIMGITKLCAESIVRNRGKKFVAVRFGNVLNSRGSVLEIWKRQMLNDEPLTLTNPLMERYMMTIPEAVKLTIKAAEKAQGGELMVLDMGERIKMGDFINNFIERHGYRGGIKVIGTRRGEQKYEELMTEYEKSKAKKKGNIWIIK